MCRAKHVAMSEEKAKLTRSSQGQVSQGAPSSARDARGWTLGPCEHHSQLGLQHGWTSQQPPPGQGTLSAPRDQKLLPSDWFFFQLSFGRMTTWEMLLVLVLGSGGAH